jgi:cytochrome P450
MDAGAAKDNVATLDVMRPDFRPDAAQVLAAREANWYARTPVGYALLRYRQAGAVLGDRRFQQSVLDLALERKGVTSGLLYDWLSSNIIRTEGDHHLRLRRLVSKAFTPRSVERLHPLMREVAQEILNRFAKTGQCDFMADFADEYPARIMCELLGVPAGMQPDFRGWANDLGLAFAPDMLVYKDRVETALAGLMASTDVLIGRRRGRPGPDLLSALIAAEESGDRLSNHELRLMVSTLMFGGLDTTRNQLGRAMVVFAEHPDQWRLLAERPELAAQATEEVIRVAPTTPMNGRIALETVTIDGLTIPAGTFVHIITLAANTDPEVFGRGGFDITVPRPAPSLIFGGGMHYCLGAPLARAEIAQALPVLAGGMPGLRLAGPVRWRPPIGITGPSHLPLRFAVPV